MKILYIGYLMPEEEYKQNKALSFAAGRFERGLVKGLSNQNSVDLAVATIEPQEFKFPTGKFWVGTKKYGISGTTVSARTIHYVNFPFIKHLCLYLGLRRWIKKEAKKNDENELAVISYNADVPVIQVGLWAEKKGYKYYPVLSDLPFYDELHSPQNLSQRLSILGYKSQIKNLNRIKHAIVLNQNTANDFSINDSILVEGAISSDEVNGISRNNKPDEKIVLYCGILNSFHGTDVLLEVAKRQPQFEFWICGRGDASEEKVKEAEREYSNIKFFGAVSDEELVRLQERASLLIIPHPTSPKQLRYQFPSKLMTCLSTGVPVLVTPIPGITEEYKKYVIMTEDDTAECIAENVEKFFNHEFEDVGISGRNFVVNYKTWEKQSERIIQHIKGEVL